MKWLTDSWYHPSLLRWLLWPLSAIYRVITHIRRLAYHHDFFTRHQMPVPVIVVGNISVGGTGKTPFVIWLAQQLLQAGYQPGIISRGYGGHAAHYPVDVNAASNPKQAGDEPVLIARQVSCPIVVDPNRSRAAAHLLSQHQCDVIISDDGLQHYALKRDIEIVLVDGQRRFGNKYCLPAGPLREPMSRLKQVDFVVYHGNDDASDYQMQLKLEQLINLHDNNQTQSLDELTGEEVHAVAAIGNPQRFFDQLCQHGLIVHPHAFTDHHPFTASDLAFGDKLPILMTEKDAVKCLTFATAQMWTVPAKPEISPKLITHILNKLKESSHG